MILHHHIAINNPNWDDDGNNEDLCLITSSRLFLCVGVMTTTTTRVLSSLLLVMAALQYRGCSGARTVLPGNRLPDIVPGKAGIDYPVASSIPETKFRCSDQIYSGYFADPDTHCQVMMIRRRRIDYDDKCQTRALKASKHLPMDGACSNPAHVNPEIFKKGRSSNSFSLTG